MIVGFGIGVAMAAEVVNKFEIIDELNAIGNKACRGDTDALAELDKIALGTDARAGHALMNLAYLVEPFSRCTAGGFDHDKEKWQAYLERSVLTDWPFAKGYYGEILLKGMHYIPADPPRGISLLSEAARGGEDYAAEVLVIEYYDAKFAGTKDLNKALEWAELALSRERPLHNDLGFL